MFQQLKGFSLVEITIASGIFALFLAGVLMLYKSGHTAGNQSFWLQKTSMNFRNSFQQINNVISRSSYPSTIVFPGKCFVNTRNEFKVHISNRKILCATEAIQLKTYEKPGTIFLRVTESSPEKIQGINSQPASITYHIYSLTNSGKILYHRYIESVKTGEPKYIETLVRTRIPSEETKLAGWNVLIDDVEFIQIEPQKEFGKEGFFLKVSCVNPKGNTRRVEEISCSPNVEVVVHPYDPDW